MVGEESFSPPVCPAAYEPAVRSGLDSWISMGGEMFPCHIITGHDLRCGWLIRCVF